MQTSRFKTLQRRGCSLALCVLVFLFGACGGGGSSTPPPPPPVTIPVASSVAVDVTSTVSSGFEGMGVEWDPYEFPPSSADWATTLARLDYMKPGFFRIMQMADSYCLGFDVAGNPQYVWNATDPNLVQQKLGGLFQLLDYAQSRNIDVILGEWSWPSGLSTPGASSIAGPDDPRWAQLSSDFADYLINTRKYTVIRSYNYMNEPNGSWMWPAGVTPNFNLWATGIRNLRSDLDARGLTSLVIVGPDNAGSWEWLDQAAQGLSAQVDVWDMHWYATNAETEGGQIESLLTTKRAMLATNDTSPRAASKLRVLAESGMLDGKTSTDQQPRVRTFEYGVHMADLAAQVARAGWHGASAWQLDDAMHSNGAGSLKLWGFWNTKDYAGDPAEGIRPWFYTWSLIARNMPRGARIVSTTSGGQVAGLRATAAAWKVAGVDQYTILLVNDSDTNTTVTVTMPGVGSPTLQQYNYFDTDRVTDGNGFPVVKVTLTNVNLTSGVSIAMPARGVVVLTTAP